MRFALLLPAVLIGGLATAAEMPIDPPPSSEVEVLVTKITCSVDSALVIIDKDGQEIIQRKSGLSHESTRNSWKEGEVEYRLSESLAYDNDGTPYIKSRSFTKVTEKFEGNKLTRTSEMRQVNWLLPKGQTWGQPNGEKFKESNSSVVQVFEVHGNQRIQVKLIENGQTKPVNGLVETEYTISPNKKMITYIEKTPYEESLEGGVKIRVEKAETTCLYETQ